VVHDLERTSVARYLTGEDLPPHLELLGNSLWLLSASAFLPGSWIRGLCSIEAWELVVIQVRPAGPRSPRLIPSWAKLVASEFGEVLWTGVVHLENPLVCFAARCDVTHADQIATRMGDSTAYSNTLLCLVPLGMRLSRDSELVEMFLRQVIEDEIGEGRVRRLREFGVSNKSSPILELRDPCRNAGLALIGGDNELLDQLRVVFSSDLARVNSDIFPLRFWPAVLI
jgi:hypothetical protein